MPAKFRYELTVITIAWGRRFVVGVAVIGLLLGGAVIGQTAAALPTTVAAAETPGQVVDVSQPELAMQPQLQVDGIVLRVAIDAPGAPRYETTVSMPDGSSVKLSTPLAASVTTGSTFAGSVAVPDAVVAAVPQQFAQQVAASPDAPLATGSAAATAVVATATAADQPMQIVAARMVTPSMAATSTVGHTVDIAIVGPASYSDPSVTNVVAQLNQFWPLQSNSIVASVTRPVATLRYTSSFTCNDYNNLWSEAATSFGHAGEAYYLNSPGAHHLIVLSTDTSSSCLEGIGTVGVSVDQGGLVVAKVGGGLDVHTIAHEFGHNLGLGHSGVTYCSGATRVDGSSADGCSDAPYDDYYDVMGGGVSCSGCAVPTTNKLATLDATHKASLGFYPAGDIVDLTTNSTVVLNAASATSGVRAFTVTDPVSSAKYYVEYRNGAGFDQSTFYTSGYENFQLGNGDEGMVNGVRVLTLRPPVAGDPATSGQSVVLRPPVMTGHTNRLLGLLNNQTFTSGSVVVKVTALTSTTATVDVRVLTVSRLAGDDRFATAVAVSVAENPTGPLGPNSVVYVANGLNYPDALSAAPAAAHRGGPLLLTALTTLPTAVANELTRLSPSRIVIVGGTGVVSDTVAAQLTALGFTHTTDRVAGDDRYATSRAVTADAFAAGGAANAFIATGNNFPDALAASAAAGELAGPVVLVNGSLDSVPPPTTQLLTSLGITKTYLAGGTGVISQGIQDALGVQFTPAKVTRLAGDDRYATSAAINKFAFGPSSGVTTVYLAVGTGYADALAGAALAGKVNAPLYVVPATCVPNAVLQDIGSLGATKIVLLGGTGSLADSVFALTPC